jgi:hypothetical protein
MLGLKSSETTSQNNRTQPTVQDIESGSPKKDPAVWRVSPRRAVLTALGGCMALAGGGFGAAHWMLAGAGRGKVPAPAAPRHSPRHYGARPKYDATWRRLVPDLVAHNLPAPPLTASTLDVYRDPATAYLPDQAQGWEVYSKEPGTQAVGQVTNAILKQPEKPVSSTDHIVLFAMFSSDGKLSPDVLYLIERLRAESNGVYAVIQVDTTDRSYADAINDFKLDPEVLKLFRGVMVRVNHGLDFSAFSHLMRAFPDLWDAAMWTLGNDSVLGPLSPESLRRTFERIRGCSSSFVGLTESMQGIDENSTQWHYQSVFPSLKHEALQHPGVQKYWLDDMFSLDNKTEIIETYELGMAQHMRDLGLSTEALFSLFDLDPYANPTVSFADVLIERDYPFLKKSLFRFAALEEQLEKVNLLSLEQRFPFNLTGHVGQGHIPPVPLGSSSGVVTDRGLSHLSCRENDRLPTCPSLRIPTRANHNGLAICAQMDAVVNPVRWLNHHRQLGVERFYLYQFNTSSLLTETAPETFAFGDVRLEFSNNAYGRPTRAAIFAECLENFGAEHSWMAFLPENSYLVSPSGQTSLPELLKKFSEYGALAVHRRQMGDLVPLALGEPGDHEPLVHCLPSDDPDCENVHLIANTKLLKSTADGQKGYFVGGAYAVNEQGQRVNGSSSSDVSMQHLELQRYPLENQNIAAARLANFIAEDLDGDAELLGEVEELSESSNHRCSDGRIPLRS